MKKTWWKLYEECGLGSRWIVKDRNGRQKNGWVVDHIGLLPLVQTEKCENKNAETSAGDVIEHCKGLATRLKLQHLLEWENF